MSKLSLIAEPSHRESRDANAGMKSKMSPSSMKRPKKKTKSVSPPRYKLIGASCSNASSLADALEESNLVMLDGRL